jgi:hypothetical protein
VSQAFLGLDPVKPKAPDEENYGYEWGRPMALVP